MLVGTWQRLWWGLEAGRELLAHSRVTNSTCFAFENLIENTLGHTQSKGSREEEGRKEKHACPDLQDPPNAHLREHPDFSAHLIIIP